MENTIYIGITRDIPFYKDVIAKLDFEWYGSEQNTYDTFKLYAGTNNWYAIVVDPVAGYARFADHTKLTKFVKGKKYKNYKLVYISGILNNNTTYEIF